MCGGRLLCRFLEGRIISTSLVVGIDRDPSIKSKKKPAKKGKKGEDDEESEEAEEEEAAAEEENKAPEYARKSGKHKGSNAGLKAFVIAQVG